MDYFICEKCQMRYYGWSDNEICPKCGTKLKRIDEEEFYLKEEKEKSKKIGGNEKFEVFKDFPLAK